MRNRTKNGWPNVVLLTGVYCTSNGRTDETISDFRRRIDIHLLYPPHFHFLVQVLKEQFSSSYSLKRATFWEIIAKVEK